MRADSREIKHYAALNILTRLGIAPGANFHTLDSATVENLLLAADLERYRAPRNANGSRARYYHDMLQRRAAADV